LGVVGGIAAKVATNDRVAIIWHKLRGPSALSASSASSAELLPSP
jgi:hypothetical protein